MDGQTVLLTAPRRVQMEVKRLGLNQDAPVSNLIYHYTDPNGFLGILQSQELWLTDYAYLNDYREVAHGIAIAASVLNDWADKYSLDDLRYQTIAVVQRELEDLRHHRIALACFSEDGDSLSQWRAYGSIAIGFTASSLASGISTGTDIGRVVYNGALQDTTLQVEIHECMEAIRLDCMRGLQYPAEMLGTIIAGWIIRRISYFKDDSFKEEREIRCRYVQDERINESFSSPVAPMHFRVKGGAIISYARSSELLLGSPYLPETSYDLPIAEVIIGPGSRQDVLLRGVKDALTSLGYGEVPVHRSRIPFRTL